MFVKSEEWCIQKDTRHIFYLYITSFIATVLISLKLHLINKVDLGIKSYCLNFLKHKLTLFWSKYNSSFSIFQDHWTTALQTLDLNLDEIVHIRSVLTKAELEGLPLDGNLKEDVEKGKVCFLCMKTRFGFFNRGCKCELCTRQVCSKCTTKVIFTFFFIFDKGVKILKSTFIFSTS